MITWIIIAAIILALVIRSFYELHHLKISEYKICSDKIPDGMGSRIVFLSDLHLRKYGEHNEILIRMVRDCHPDLILLGGDMILKKTDKNEEHFYEVLKDLPKIAPVLYAPGNHESFIREFDLSGTGRYGNLLEQCQKYGVHFLSNESVTVPFRQISSSENDLFTETAASVESVSFRSGKAQNTSNEATDKLVISGLDLSSDFYGHKDARILLADDITAFLGQHEASQKSYTVLLAHPPAFFDAYAKYGADLVFAGHYHGGAIRFGKVGLVSPQVRFFPKYSAGKFVKGNTVMIVSRGAGSHSVNLRLFNYPEIVCVELQSH